MIVAVTQRVTVISEYGERRDSLDQCWSAFFHECGIVPLVIPNHLEIARSLIESVKIEGILLTGGDDLAILGGTVPERDETELFLMGYALEKDLPVLGVCRGMQFIQSYFGVPLHYVEGHVQKEQLITINGISEVVNSYHQYGTTQTCDDLEVWALASDGVVKGIRHKRRKIEGIMWHPERFRPFRDADKLRICKFYKGIEDR